MKKWLIAILFFLFVGLVYLSINGLFRDMEVRQAQMPGYRVVGIQHKGSYQKIGKSFERMKTLADSVGIPVSMIGIYLDDPEMVHADSLRSVAGMVVSQQDSIKLSRVEGLIAMTIPAGPAAVVDFRTESNVAMIIGALKAYPVLSDYIKSANKADDVEFVYEVYEDKSTRYVMQYKP